MGRNVSYVWIGLTAVDAGWMGRDEMFRIFGLGLLCTPTYSLQYRTGRIRICRSGLIAWWTLYGRIGGNVSYILCLEYSCFDRRGGGGGGEAEHVAVVKGWCCWWTRTSCFETNRWLESRVVSRWRSD